MYVASHEGTILLSCEMSDPCLCPYSCDGAFSPEEIKSRSPRRNRFTTLRQPKITNRIDN